MIQIIYQKSWFTPKGDPGRGANIKFLLQYLFSFVSFLHMYLFKYLIVSVMLIVTIVTNIIVSILVYFPLSFFLLCKPKPLKLNIHKAKKGDHF